MKRPRRVQPARPRAFYGSLKKHYRNVPFDRLRLWMSFPKRLVPDTGSEETTRGRSFLFFSCGVFAGSGLGRAFTLKVPENGLIALNVPLDPLRLGSLSTRTTHPFYTARWNELVRVLCLPATLDNPYWDRTKGEMVAELCEPVSACKSYWSIRCLAHRRRKRGGRVRASNTVGIACRA